VGCHPIPTASDVSIHDPRRSYTVVVERKAFWLMFVFLSVVADFVLPGWWALGATIPIFFVSWWIAYRTGWF